MHYCMHGKVNPTQFVVTCKRCARHIPSGVTALPKDNLVVRCALCGELRRYRPSEVYLGFPASQTDAKSGLVRRHRGSF